MEHGRTTAAQLVEQRGIVDLAEIVSTLADEDRTLFDRIFSVQASVGELDPPEHMYRWIERYFGSVAAVVRQKVVKVTNRRTLDETLFNELRARRPLEARIPAELADEIAKTAPDPFCEPLMNTPADTFGRVLGAHTVTASNIAKYDGFHGVVIFDEHDPLAFTEALAVDAIQVAQEWFDDCHQQDPAAVYPFFMWNCLWKSGASIPHGHAQVSVTRGMQYAKIERLRRAAVDYRREYGTGYWDDLFRVHQALGLGAQAADIRVMANLTPLKEKELVLTAPAVSDELAHVMYQTLRCLVEELNVVSFNLVVVQPPLAPTEEDWSDMPVVVRIVDRGDPLNRTSDFGAMELYAASVVSSDPFRVAEVLWNGLDRR
ncbi:MAG TPA: hypothetical protein VFN57_02420 [Thermomicrobiaceae bacterium]|nr:hypothetical protein [Thermomicrobiaceae bacterium]